MSKKSKFKVGNTVKVISNNSQDSHTHRGKILKVIDVHDGNWDGDLEYIKKCGDYWYNLSTNIGVWENDIELVENTKSLGDTVPGEGFVIDEYGMSRENKEGKIDYTLIPPEVLEAVAIHFTKGSEDHGVDNWKKTKNMGSFLKGMYRHMMAILMGKKDEDHYSALIWNVMCLKWNELQSKEVNDTK